MVIWTRGHTIVPQSGRPSEMFIAWRDGRSCARILRAEPWAPWTCDLYDDCCALEGETFARRVDAKRAVEEALKHAPHSRCGGDQ